MNRGAGAMLAGQRGVLEVNSLSPTGEDQWFGDASGNQPAIEECRRANLFS